MLGQMAYGLAFVVPEVLDEVSPLELSLGRYLVYGGLSVAVLAMLAPARRRTLNGRAWRAASVLGLAGNTGYYLLVVLGVRYAGAPVTTLIVGALPVTLAIAGSRAGGIRPRSLVLPLSMTVTGLILVNADALLSAPDTGGSVAIGIAAAVAALAAWTGFGLANARFLARHPDLDLTAWTSALGVTSMAWALPALAFVGRSSTALEQPVAFLAGALALGAVSSWAATAAWNRAASRIPVSLAGQLVVIETVSGITYSYLHRATTPSTAVLAGGALLVAGALVAVRSSTSGRSAEQGQPPGHRRDAVAGADDADRGVAQVG
ncbi:DMT family transporter [Pseudonocardia eucalypti]|uniref:DMT family transporter n=1 Tax=Pseudonocardia eucalypti TaxID=648755 RepID=A0ABP9PKZ4_9PSEU